MSELKKQLEIAKRTVPLIAEIILGSTYKSIALDAIDAAITEADRLEEENKKLRRLLGQVFELPLSDRFVDWDEAVKWAQETEQALKESNG